MRAFFLARDDNGQYKLRQQAPEVQRGPLSLTSLHNSETVRPAWAIREKEIYVQAPINLEEVRNETAAPAFKVVDVDNASLIRGHEQALSDVNACISCTGCSPGCSGYSGCIGCSATFHHTNTQQTGLETIEALAAAVAA